MKVLATEFDPFDSINHKNQLNLSKSLIRRARNGALTIVGGLAVASPSRVAQDLAFGCAPCANEECKKYIYPAPHKRAVHVTSIR